MDRSWIKLHRKFLESPLWKYAIQANYPILISFWMYLLISVNWDEKKWYDGKEENLIPAGSLITSQMHLAEYFGVSRQTIRTCLQHLVKMKMITSTTTNKWTQVWVVNWTLYQMKDNSNNQPSNQRVDNDKTTGRQRVDTTKEYKNIEIKNNGKPLQKVEYGGPQLNEITIYLKEKLGLPLLDDSIKNNRYYASLCIKKFGFDKTKLAIDATAQSKFWHTKITSFSGLYYNAVKIVSSLRGEVKSVDATKVLDSKNERREGVFPNTRRISDIKTSNS